MTLGTIVGVGPTESSSSSSSSSIVLPYFFHDVYDPTSKDNQLLSSTGYSNIFSNNLHNQFNAEKTECIIELLVFNDLIAASGRITSARLNGNNTTLDSDEFSKLHGGNTTERRFHKNDESDTPYITCVWHLTGLTIGTTYDLYPQMKSNSSSNFISAGEDRPSCILRGYYLPSSSS